MVVTEKIKREYYWKDKRLCNQHDPDSTQITKQIEWIS
ncbi:hypothetical protein J729_4624, partial [Acinetobacter baumannii 929679-598]